MASEFSPTATTSPEICSNEDAVENHVYTPDDDGDRTFHSGVSFTGGPSTSGVRELRERQRKGVRVTFADPLNQPSPPLSKKLNHTYSNSCITSNDDGISQTDGGCEEIGITEPVEDWERNFSTLRAMYGGGFSGFVAAFSVRFSDSVYMIPLQIALLGMPISACIMGHKYFDACPMTKVIPASVAIMGVVGVLVLVLRIAFVILMHFRFRRIDGMRRIITCLNIFLFLMYIIEMGNFYTHYPHFDSHHARYCDPVFHHYVLWVNRLLLLLLINLLSLHMPSYLLRRWRRAEL